MENIDTKKKIIGLPATIVAGIFLSIALLFAIIALTMNLKVAFEQYSASVQETVNESEDPSGAGVAMAFASIFGAMAILIIHYFVIVIPFIITLIMLIPVIKTLKKADLKAIRIINFVYLGLIIAIGSLCILKFILYVTGVA